MPDGDDVHNVYTLLRSLTGSLNQGAGPEEGRPPTPRLYSGGRLVVISLQSGHLVLVWLVNVISPAGVALSR